jgi:hypothetical protein
VIALAETNRDVGVLAWQFVRDNWDALLSRFASPNVIALAGGARWLTAPDDVADVQAFFAEHDIPQNHLTLVQAMERQRTYAEVRVRVSADLAARFGG